MGLDGYHSRLVSIISFGFYTPMGKYNFDVISSTVTEDSHCSSLALTAALAYLREHNILDALAYPNVQIWSDVGKHFRSKEMAYFVFNEFKNRIAAKCNLTLNFLVKSTVRVAAMATFALSSPTGISIPRDTSLFHLGVWRRRFVSAIRIPKTLTSGLTELLQTLLFMNTQGLQ